MRVVVVGGGASGTLVAARLRAALAAGSDIVVLEPGGYLGEGIAYATDDVRHLLNVRAGGMSALPEDPGHFATWAGCDASEFLPRLHYGPYLRDLLADAGDAPVLHVRDRAVDVVDNGDGVRVVSGSGASFEADAVVLATGHVRPALSPGLLVDDGAYSRVHVDPWSVRPSRQRLLVLGAGLTAMDLALTHLSGNPGAHVTVMSRSGRLPLAHADGLVPALPIVDVADISAGMPLWQAHRRLRTADEDPRALVDGMRPHSPALWAQLGPRGREQFVRHVQRRWDVVRHRMAPQVAQAIHSWRVEGRLAVVTGTPARIGSSGDAPRVISAEGGAWEADEVVVATGPADAPDGLLATLALAPDPLGRGVAVDPQSLRPLRADGTVWERAHVIGPPARGTLFESTAMPEIRVQAQRIAHALASG